MRNIPGMWRCWGNRPHCQPATLSFGWESVAPRCQWAVAGDGESGGVVLARLEFEDGKMTSFSLLPVHLNFERKDDMNGLPVAATGPEAEAILDILNGLSEEYGLKLKLENGLLVRA